MLSKNKTAAAAAKMQFRNELKSIYAIDELTFSFSEGVDSSFENLTGFESNSVLLALPRLRKDEVAGYSVLQIQHCPGTASNQILTTLFRGLFAIQKVATAFNKDGRAVSDFAQKYLRTQVIYKTNAEGKINKALAVRPTPGAVVNNYGILTTRRESLRTVGVVIRAKEFTILDEALEKSLATFNSLLQKKAASVKKALEFKNEVNKLYLKLAMEKSEQIEKSEQKINAALGK